MNLICPVCGRVLIQETAAQSRGRYVCGRGHTFDRAKSGYVNLLQRQRHRQRGDDPVMVAARRSFLDAGFYRPLCDAVAAAIPENARSIADIGCGEGWYSCNLLQARQETELIGFDISPDAVRFAGVRARQAGLEARSTWVVASVNRIPLSESVCDCIVNLFAPCAPEEFARILKPDGVLIRAIPLERHLWELKCAIYDEPYENRPVFTPPEGFILKSQKLLRFPMNVSGQSLHDLFAMTPYARKTSPEDAAKLLALDSLTVSAEFGVLVFARSKT